MIYKNTQKQLNNLFQKAVLLIDYAIPTEFIETENTLSGNRQI